jgi:hypothetical protein
MSTSTSKDIIKAVDGVYAAETVGLSDDDKLALLKAFAEISILIDDETRRHFQKAHDSLLAQITEKALLEDVKKD